MIFIFLGTQNISEWNAHDYLVQEYAGVGTGGVK